MHVTAMRPERHPDAVPSVEPPASPFDHELEALGIPQRPAPRWHVAESRPGRCGTLARALGPLGVPYYRAMGRFRVVWSDGTPRWRPRPLFPGYVFILADDAGRQVCRRHHACLAVRDIPDQQRFREELASLDALMAVDEGIELGPAVRVGERVRVEHGPYRGAVGLVRRLGTRGRLYVELHTLGQSASVELDLAHIEPVR